MKKCNNKIIISGEDLCKRKIYNINLKLKKSNNTLVKGNIKNPDGSYSFGACIEVVEVNIYYRKILGCTFTDCKGNFGVALKINLNACYEFNIYSPV